MLSFHFSKKQRGSAFLEGTDPQLAHSSNLIQTLWKVSWGQERLQLPKVILPMRTDNHTNLSPFSPWLVIKVQTIACQECLRTKVSEAASSRVASSADYPERLHFFKFQTASKQFLSLRYWPKHSKGFAETFHSKADTKALIHFTLSWTERLDYTDHCTCASASLFHSLESTLGSQAVPGTHRSFQP